MLVQEGGQGVVVVVYSFICGLKMSSGEKMEVLCYGV